MCSNWGWEERDAEGQDTSRNKQHDKHKVICRMQVESNVQRENRDRLWEGEERALRQMSIFDDEG